jgi:aspartyl-tRNA(Asn)/glutamyl-tRNA(Gln) amidotransferase subunit A
MVSELTWAPAWRIRDLVASGEVSAAEVLGHFLARIEGLDPDLRAFAVLDSGGATVQARRADDAVRTGEQLGPLHGVPIAVKAQIPVDGLAGSGPGDAKASHDALCVERLRRAGAVIVGNTTMTVPVGRGIEESDWANQARNPWDLDRVTGGSSAGAAAAAAARLVPITIGADGGGSTRVPAAYTGIVGVHTTAGLVPTVRCDRAALPLYTATVGPMCRDVQDAAAVLQAIAGPDGRDFLCVPTAPGDYLAGLHDGVEGLRFGWTDDFGFADEFAESQSDRVVAAVRGAAAGFGQMGASVDPVTEGWDDPWQAIVTTDPVLQGASAVPSAQAWRKALDLRHRSWATMQTAFETFDLLLSPTAQVVAPTVTEWEANWMQEGPASRHGIYAAAYTSLTSMLSWLGLPATSVPCGYVNGLPIGLQIIARPGQEAQMLRAAQAFQTVFPRLEHPVPVADVLPA